MSSPELRITWDDIQEFMQELRQTARSLLAREGNAGSVLTTQLVNSALKKLKPRDKEWEEVTWDDRENFFKDAHFSMRRLLVDYARRRNARRQVQVGGFESEQIATLSKNGDLDLDRLVEDASGSTEFAEAVAVAMEELERLYPEQKLAAIVQHRVFDGLTQEEIAKLLGVTERTVRTRQKLAYGLLRKALQPYLKRE